MRRVFTKWLAAAAENQAATAVAVLAITAWRTQEAIDIIGWMLFAHIDPIRESTGADIWAYAGTNGILSQGPREDADAFLDICSEEWQRQIVGSPVDFWGWAGIARPQSWKMLPGGLSVPVKEEGTISLFLEGWNFLTAPGTSNHRAGAIIYYLKKGK